VPVGTGSSRRKRIPLLCRVYRVIIATNLSTIALAGPLRLRDRLAGAGPGCRRSPAGRAAGRPPGTWKARYCQQNVTRERTRTVARCRFAEEGGPPPGPGRRGESNPSLRLGNDALSSQPVLITDQNILSSQPSSRQCVVGHRKRYVLDCHAESHKRFEASKVAACFHG
jgi:hypothetical protein